MEIIKEQKKELIFAFDLGTGSIGECVRQGKEVKHLDVLLVDHEYACTKKLRDIRRRHRTILSHRSRENWWREQAKLAGIEVLSTAQPTKENPNLKPDPRMLKEFSVKGETIIYNSVLLRIALLRGKKLEGWQVFKAIWSAIQHRGYDNNLPWKAGCKNNEEENQLENVDKKSVNDDEEENKKGIKEYQDKLKKYFGDKKEFHFPCYYEAYCMGIWDFNNPDDLNRQLSKNPNPARNKDKNNMAIIPRELIKKEIEQLLKQASRQYLKLQGKEKFIMYGEGEQEYSSYNNKNYKKFRGTEWDWQGLLGQKIPRFDNRIISKCSLISRFNVCKSNEPLNQDITVLMQLLNCRFIRSGREGSLTADELNKIFEKHENKIVRKGQKSSDKKVITKREWNKIIKEMGCSTGEIEIEQPKSGGRSRFCRPALRILKDLILSGKNPHDYYQEIIKNITNQDKMKGLIIEDYKFLLNMPNDWNKIYIPDDRYELKDIDDERERYRKITEILGQINNPIVKHRLGLFLKRLEELQKEFGKPDKIFLEIAREDFMSEKRKKEYTKNQNKNKKEIEDAEKSAKGQSVFKMRLYREQGGIDVYDLSENRKLNQTDLAQYEIDHIVPRSLGGSDSIVNKVLTKQDLNSKNNKGNRTPYQWFLDQGRLEEFINHIKDMKTLKKHKIKLLISENAQEMEKIKTDLQATMYLEKLTQKIASLYFNWGQQTKDDTRKVYFVTSGRTAQIRRNLDLNKILYPEKIEKMINIMLWMLLL